MEVFLSSVCIAPSDLTARFKVVYLLIMSTRANWAYLSGMVLIYVYIPARSQKNGCSHVCVPMQGIFAPFLARQEKRPQQLARA